MSETTYMTEEEIMTLRPEDLRELTPDEDLHDNFRRMFQLMGLIYQNQIDIKNTLDQRLASQTG